MGLFDEIVKGVTGKLLGGGGESPLLNVLMGLINNPQTGGLSGLLQMFSGKGLGDAVSSWISTGENLPISADQIQNALGGQEIQQIAQQLGASREDTASGLAALLPQIVDHLTPEGRLPEGGALEEALNMLKGRFSGG